MFNNLGFEKSVTNNTIIIRQLKLVLNELFAESLKMEFFKSKI